jgi:hypothetical protein
LLPDDHWIKQGCLVNCLQLSLLSGCVLFYGILAVSSLFGTLVWFIDEHELAQASCYVMILMHFPGSSMYGSIWLHKLGLFCGPGFQMELGIGTRWFISTCAKLQWMVFACLIICLLDCATQWLNSWINYLHILFLLIYAWVAMIFFTGVVALVGFHVHARFISSDMMLLAWAVTWPWYQLCTVMI